MSVMGAFGEDAKRSGPRAEWPLIVLMAVVAIGGAWGLIASEWGKGGPQKVAAAVADHGSLLDDGRFAAALRDLRAEVGPQARVTLMRVDAGQVWTVLRVPDGTTRVVRIGADGERSTSITNGGAGGGISLDDVQAGAPARMIAALRRDHRIEPDRIDFFSLSGVLGRASWNVFLLAEENRLPAQFTANARGDNLKRVG